MKKAKIPEEAKLSIVRSLACYDSPASVAATLEAEYQVKVTRQSIESYDPTKMAGARIAPKWRELFERTRRSYLDDISKIGISHLAFRIRALQRIYERAESKGNSELALRVLDQAAKEMGGMYSNRQVLNHTGGVTLVVSREDANL